ncbi:response regulator aspartate phosphatase C [Bacillus sp. IT-79MI2]|uniref:response regulator aspartate phosphatase n=1 Tax=Bacillus sp. IT-79MI2 TaxID=3026438 RepID=UPI0039E19EBF
MSTHVVTKEQMKHSLDTWYQVMLQQQVEKATRCKEEIDNNLNQVEANQDVLLYYALLNFRYNVLTDWVAVKEDSFDRVESFEIPTEGLLAYYYHFFKGFHLRLITNYTEAKEQFDQAEKLLQYITNPFEKAEFNYRLGEFYYHSYQQVKAIDFIQKAKEEFSKQSGYEINLALCENIYGLCCIDLKQFELAEETLNATLDVFQKTNHEKYILMVRNNLGLLYANQNVSESAIRHLSEVTKKSPNHFRALYLEADENLKLNRSDIAESLIEKGLHICNQFKNQEYQYRFMILKEMNTNINAFEKAVLKGIMYFEKEELFDCIEEYAERLADKFYNENNHEKASKYYHMSKEARKKQIKKGALK